MSFFNLFNNIVLIARNSFNRADQFYNVIVNNKLILAFVLMFAIFLGCALIKRLIRL